MHPEKVMRPGYNEQYRPTAVIWRRQPKFGPSLGFYILPIIIRPEILVGEFYEEWGSLRAALLSFDALRVSWPHSDDSIWTDMTLARRSVSIGYSLVRQ